MWDAKSLQYNFGDDENFVYSDYPSIYIPLSQNHILTLISQVLQFNGYYNSTINRTAW